jgi:hypothetical protein
MFPFARGSFVGGVCLNSWRVAVVLAPLSLLAAEGPTFDYLQVIESELEPGRVYQFDLPEEVFDGARAFPQDFRVMDASGFAWPFVVHTPREESSLATLTTRKLREESFGGEQPFVEIELQVFANQLAGGKLEHNVLTIRTSGQAYKRRVEIFAKDPEGKLQPLGSGHLVHFGPAANAVLRRVRYADAAADILVVRIRPEPGAAVDFSVTQLHVGHQRFRAGEIRGVPLQLEQAPEAGEGAGWASAIYDSGFISRPIDTLRFDFSEGAIICAARIYGRNNPSNTWQLVSEPVLQSSARFPRVDVPLRRCTFRWLKVDIFHGSAPPVVPLSIRAFATPRRVIFEAMTNDRGVLRYGTAGPLAPVPPATRRMNQSDLRMVPVVELGERRVFASLQQANKALKKMFYFSLAAVGGLVAFLIFMRRAFN